MSLQPQKCADGSERLCKNRRRSSLSFNNAAHISRSETSRSDERATNVQTRIVQRKLYALCFPQETTCELRSASLYVFEIKANSSVRTCWNCAIKREI